MAPKMTSHQPVGEAFLAGAKFRVSRRTAVPADAVWSAFLDGKAWTDWLPLTGVTWTSPRPFGMGTTRTVEIGAQRVEETFFAWTEGERMAFRFDRSTFPVQAAVEDYQVRPVPGGCEVTWTGRATGTLGLGVLIGWALAGGIARGLPKLEALLVGNPDRYR
jgi:hypothetical protein